MQLRLKPRDRRSFVSRYLIFRVILIVMIFFLTIFLLDKIDFPKPTKLIKQEISNDKFIKLK